MAAMAFCAMMSAFVLAVYWMKTGIGSLLMLAQAAAALAALLRLREAVLEAGLVFKAWRYVKDSWRGVRRDDIRQLRSYVLRSIVPALGAWPVVVGMACLPFLMHLPVVIPGGEEVFAIATLLFVMHFAAAEVSYRRLAGAVVDSLDSRYVCALRV
ncbi:hypothetical protein [Lysobacter capsici]|uniref:hypothetical protein n=1 Tax=Lysobacter capsici TaxID=435897 RepID=UPI00128E26C0|nr:hypothetical protein [Lysobacter capsici]